MLFVLRGRATLTAVMLLGLLAPACKPSDFDDALVRAPVLSVGPPGGYKARDVGKVVLPLSLSEARKAAGVSARFLVSGVDYPSLAVVELDASGRESTFVASEAQLADLTSESKAALLSAAEIVDPTATAGTTRVVLGAPHFGAVVTGMNAHGRIFYLDITDNGKGIDLKLSRGPDPGTRSYVGLGVAAGKVSGTDKPDVVVASLSETILYEDGNDAVSIENAGCSTTWDNLDIEDKWKFRPVVIGDVATAAGHEGGEILVGVPQKVAPGKVQVLHRAPPTMASPNGVLECVTTLEPEMGSPQPHFGVSVAVADLDGDQQQDVLVGDGAGVVHVFYGPIDAKPPRAPLRIHSPFPMGANQGDFGYRVVVMDVDGNPGNEVVISAPEAALNDKIGVGQVFVYSKDGIYMSTLTQDSSPADKVSVGLTLSSTPFSTCGITRDILLIGSVEQVFAYFRLPGGPPDPRCFK
jgi:hypothetical protein